MKMLVLPRDPNPYQGLLYGALGRLGVRIRYLGELTPSHTVNLLLLPAELAWHRMAGTRVVHLHWVFPFTLPGARRFPVLRRLGQAWFLLWLRACRALGLRLVWTAHNVLPHAPVFADDVAARRALVRASDLVLAHSPAALAELAALGAVPRRSAVIEAWPAAPGATPATSLRQPGSPGGPRRFLFFGRVEQYKGVADLLSAFAGLAAETAAELTVACRVRTAGSGPNSMNSPAGPAITRSPCTWTGSRTRRCRRCWPRPTWSCCRSAGSAPAGARCWRCATAAR